MPINTSTGLPEQNSQDIKAQLVAEALGIVTGARLGAYGKPEKNFERIARLWNAYLENRPPTAPGIRLIDLDVAQMMVLVKMARMAETPAHRDSIVDILGYTLCYGELALLQQLPYEPAYRTRDAVE